MQDGHALLMFAARLGLLIGVPAFLALLLRLAGAGRSGALRSIATGSIAGVLLGPGIAGRLAPDVWGRVFSQAEPATPGIVAILSIAIFAAGWAGRRPSSAGQQAGPHDLLTALGAAFLSLAMTALPVAILLGWLFDLDRLTGLAFGAAFGSGSAFAHVTLRRIRPIGRSTDARLFLGCSLLLSFGLIAALAPPDRVWVLLVLAGAYTAGTIASRLAPLSARGRGILRGLLLALMAGCAARLASLLDPASLTSGWQPVAFVLAVLLVSDDLAAMGAGLGWLTLGRAGSGLGSARRYMESQGRGASLTMVAFGSGLWMLGMLNPGTAAGSAVVVALLLRGAAGEAFLGGYRAILDAAAGDTPDEW